MNKVAILLISLYQKIAHFFPSQCIYIPTCSCYAKDAFTQYPFFKAFGLALKRIVKCHPFAKGGYDPVQK
ncbi:MAG: membrane protein insertion efficiency factor YidD [Candidatus Omnitrophota bacterium]